MYRNTYANIYLENIKYNVATVIKNFPEYKYYFGVVKADCYEHGIHCINKIIEGGCNYLAVATLEEALEIRKEYPTFPILCLGNVLPESLIICKENNITVTVNSLEYVKMMLKQDIYNLKVHIKVNTGMNRLGIDKVENLKESITLLKTQNVIIEGIYTHIYHAEEKIKTKRQFTLFEKMFETIKEENIPIVHCQASEAITNYPKLSFVNGCRLGIIMYGFTNNSKLNLKPTFKLCSQIVQIHSLKQGETIGYNSIYQAKEEEQIAVVAIGYADGIIRKNTGRYVYIHNKKYPIVGNICMDMLFVKIDKNINLYDTVEIIKDNKHIEDIANHLETIPYEILCCISKRVPRVYINNNS